MYRLFCLNYLIALTPQAAIVKSITETRSQARHYAKNEETL